MRTGDYCNIQWIEVYPVDSVIQLFNKQGQLNQPRVEQLIINIKIFTFACNNYQRAISFSKFYNN